MEEEFRKAAVEALTSAAERLGVDPYRLARFLAGGRLADVVAALANDDRDEARSRSTALAEAYLEFLEAEIEIRRRGHTPGRSNGS